MVLGKQKYKTGIAAAMGVAVLFAAYLSFADSVESQSTRVAAADLSAAVGVAPQNALQHRPVDALDQRLIADLLVDSIVQIESGGNAHMVGSKGERGLMQIKADTWSEVARRHYGGPIPFNRAFESDTNRKVGAAYLNDLQLFLARHRAAWKADERSLLLACYNAGPERVRQCGFDIRRLPASTRDYITRGSALHDALLEDNNVPATAVRLAMDAGRRAGGV